MHSRHVLVLAALALACAPSVAFASRAGESKISVLPVDSLLDEELRTASLVAPDIETLQALHQDVQYAEDQFCRYLGPTPPKISIAALGSLADPSKVNPSALRMLGIEYIVTDWPAPPAGPAVTAMSERAARWYLLAYEKKAARAAPAPGKTRLVPDWFESAVGGL